MKRVLVIIANYFPNPSSVANCMKPLINHMAKTYHVDIITDRKKISVLEHEELGNVNIYRVDNINIMNANHLNELKEIKYTPALRLLTSFSIIVLKVLNLVRFELFSREKGYGGWKVNNVYSKYCELVEKQNYEFVISVSLPFKSHFIAEKIKDKKKNNIKWIVFEFDPYSYNKKISANNIQRRKMVKDEKRILDKCDYICLTPELYNFYKKEKFITISDKVIQIPYANLEKIEYDSAKVNGNFMKNNKINCLFTGQLYDDIRNPNVLLETFANINNDICLSMMTNFSEEQVKKYSTETYMPSVIPLQNRDTALYNLLQANILVNIGNTVEHQVPGKIFEYMSTGKPIIHFSKIKNDPAIKYLKNYPKVLIVYEWEVKSIDYKDKIEKFCMENMNYQLNFENVEECLREYSGSVATDRLNQILAEV